MATAFVAYPGTPEAVAHCITDAVRQANARQRHTIYEFWEDNDIAGRPLIVPILERILKSVFVVADITTLNLNVVYEIGYSIGLGKRVILLLNTSVENQRDLADRVGIFDTLGFKTYQNDLDLAGILISPVDPTPLPIRYPLNAPKPVYVLETPQRSQAMGKIISRIKKARLQYRSFAPSEEARLSALEAVEQVATSYGVVVPWLGPNDASAALHNVRAAFVAGMAHSLSKQALILQGAGSVAPLDLRDFAKIYRFPEDIDDHIAEWAPLVVEEMQRLEPVEIPARNLLQRLRMGDPMAENEFDTLGSYYIRTDSYNRALNGEANVIVGRKGSGKTALWAELRDTLRQRSRSNIVLDLKPEGYQLLKLREEILEYLTDGAKAHLLTAFWEYLILLEICYKILEKDERPHLMDSRLFEPYERLRKLYYTDELIVEGDFSERLQALSQRLVLEYRKMAGEQSQRKMTGNEITNLIYIHDMRDLRKELSNYLHLKTQIWVLFDNLDKGWSSEGLDQADFQILRCLIDAGGKVRREMKKNGHEFLCIVFVRDDVYQRLVEMSSDFGKDLKATLDWTDRELLRELIRQRLIQNDLPAQASFSTLWSRVFASHYRGEESSQYLIDRSLMRPRN
jgi:hypothetical protein